MAAEQRIPTPAELVANAGTLGSLPGSWQNVDAVLARPTASTQQIADALAADPALAVRLLRLANSPLFGLAQRVERLSQAVHLVGTRQVRDLCLAATVLDRFAGVPSTLISLKQLTMHSLTTGLFARVIAGRRREGNVERFFVAGLLHDVGLLLMLQQIPDHERSALERVATAKLPLEAAEREVLGYDHAQVGGLLVERWHLPATLSEPVAYHHLPLAAPTYRVESAAVHVANLAANLLGLGNVSAVTTPLEAKSWELLGLDPADIPAIIDEVEQQLAPVAAVMLGGTAA